MRADRLSAYGYELATSPNIAALAQRGTRFDFAAAPAPWTWPSTASILTGLDPPQHGVLSVQSCYLPNLLVTLPELFARAGFTTSGWSTNPLVHESRNWNQGFEHWNSWAWERAPIVLPEIATFLSEHPEERLFQYVHLTEPHMPYVPDAWAKQRLGIGPPPAGWDPTDYRRATQDGTRFDETALSLLQHFTPYASQLYDAEVLCADRAVGDFVELLERNGRLDNTILAVTSDHGEEFLEHGLTGHAHQLYRESIHVPLVLAGPGIPAGEQRTEPVAMQRIFSTLLESARLVSPHSTNPSLWNGAADARTIAVTDAGWWPDASKARRMLSWRTSTELVMWAPAITEGQTQVADSELAYYDLERDPLARSPMFAGSERAEKMRDQLDGWWRKNEQRGTGNLGGGSEVEELLRAAGYLK